jgi:hypothetical protein
LLQIPVYCGNNQVVSWSQPPISNSRKRGGWWRILAMMVGLFLKVNWVNEADSKHLGLGNMTHILTVLKNFQIWKFFKSENLSLRFRFSLMLLLNCIFVKLFPNQYCCLCLLELLACYRIGHIVLFAMLFSCLVYQLNTMFWPSIQIWFILPALFSKIYRVFQK